MSTKRLRRVRDPCAWSMSRWNSNTSTVSPRMKDRRPLSQTISQHKQLKKRSLQLCAKVRRNWPQNYRKQSMSWSAGCRTFTLLISKLLMCPLNYKQRSWMLLRPQKWNENSTYWRQHRMILSLCWTKSRNICKRWLSTSGKSWQKLRILWRSSIHRSKSNRLRSCTLMFVKQ